MLKTSLVRIFPVIAALIVGVFPSLLRAQEIDYLPKGGLSIKYDFRTTTIDSIYSGTDQRSMLESELKEQSLKNDEVNGSLYYQTYTQLFKLQYGLSETLNLSLEIPYINRERHSDLKVSNSSDTDQSSFAENYDSTKTDGFGDLTLGLIWRPVYNDTVDFRISGALNGDNGATHYTNPDKLSLGNGAYDVGLTMRILIYSLESRMMTDIELNSTSTLDTTVEEDSDSFQYSKASDAFLKIDLSNNTARWHYGLGLKAVVGGESIIDGTQQEDSYIAYLYRVFLNTGNLDALEESTLALPWMAGVLIENTFFGANAPGANTIGLKAVLYF